MERDPNPAERSQDDAALMAKVAQGDRVAFGQLYDRFSTPLYALALKILSNEAEAQDQLQETFLTVWNKAETFDKTRGTVFSWIVTHLRSRAIDKIRARTRHFQLLEENAPELEPAGSATPTASEAFETDERARDVRTALAQLPEAQKEVLRLAYFEGLTQAEISEKLEEPLGTIKARAHRGMERLRTLLRSLHE